MDKEFVPYKQALALKKLGFDEPCLLVYHQKKLVGVTNHEASGFMLPLISNKKLGSLTCTAPLKQQALRWFREEHGLHSYIKGMFPLFQYCIDYDTNKWENYKPESYWTEISYEEAEEACLDKLIEITKNK